MTAVTSKEIPPRQVDWPAFASGDVLALVSATQPWGPAAIAAAQIAARWGSVLTGCYLDPIARLAGSERDPTLMPLLYDWFEGSEEIAGETGFAAFAGSHGVHRTRWMTLHSGLAHSLRHLGAWHDLAVVERGMLERNGLDEAFGEALLDCRSACLLLPAGKPAATAFLRIAVGWNGRLEAVRALHAAMPFLCRAEDVCLFDGSPHHHGHGGGQPSFDPVTYLREHGIAARRKPFQASPGAAGADLLEAAARMRADLLVMGAYGHSRLQERLLGGATRFALGHAQLPVLLQH